MIGPIVRGRVSGLPSPLGGRTPRLGFLGFGLVGLLFVGRRRRYICRSGYMQIWMGMRDGESPLDLQEGGDCWWNMILGLDDKIA